MARLQQAPCSLCYGCTTTGHCCHILWRNIPFCFQVEVVDPVADYLATLKEVYDFGLLKEFIARKDFSFLFDAMNAVTGAYAKPIFVDELGAKPDSIL